MELGPILRAMKQSKTRVFLMVFEIAFTMAVVLNCLSIIADQRRTILRPTGIDEANLIVVNASPFSEDFRDPEFTFQVMDQDLAALRGLPGVVDATPISSLPLQGGGNSFQLKPLGAPNSDRVRAPFFYGDAHILNTLGLELIEGRAFTDEDVRREPGPKILNAIVTKDLADALFPDGNAIGQTVDSGSEEYPDVIVGIVDRMYTPYGGGPMETRIFIYPGMPRFSNSILYLVRAKPEAFDSVLAAIDERLLGVNRDRVVELETLLEVKGRGHFQFIVVARLLSIVVFLLLFVTALGILGMTSFAVTQRTRQIGTRRALGALKRDIVRYFLVESSLLMLMGMALGLIGAYGLNILLVTQAGATPLSLGLVAAGVLFLWLLGLAATLYPALRAARIPPALATRTV